MPGPGHSHSDLPLSDTLSARSYLELGRDELQAHVQLQSHPAEYTSTSNPSVSALSGGLIDAPSKSGPHLRPRPRPRPREPRPIHNDPKTTELLAAPGIEDPLDRPARKRGRPRLETAKDAAAIEVCVITLHHGSEGGVSEWGMSMDVEREAEYLADVPH
jgi:hypothetical protein